MSAQILPASLAEYRFPDGPEWAGTPLMAGAPTA